MRHDEKICVQVAHNNPLVSAGLRAAFAAHEDFDLVDESRFGSADVVVTDCAAGLDVMLTHCVSRPGVLILTGDTSEISIRRAMQLGVRGYLPLCSCLESVIRAARGIHAGGTVFAPIVMEKMVVSLRSRPLTARQVEVLRMIMQGMPDKAIARQLELSVGTAKSHVKAILMKLEASSRVQAIAVAMRRGIFNEAF